MASALHCRRSLRDILSVPATSARQDRRVAVPADGWASGLKFASRSWTRSRAETLAMCGLTPADVDWLIPHQANVRILEATRGSWDRSAELIVTVDRHAKPRPLGPLALDVRFETGGSSRVTRSCPGEWRRLHLGAITGGDVSVKYAMVFPGQGSQSAGMLAATATCRDP